MFSSYLYKSLPLLLLTLIDDCAPLRTLHTPSLSQTLINLASDQRLVLALLPSNQYMQSKLPLIPFDNFNNSRRPQVDVLRERFREMAAEDCSAKSTYLQVQEQTKFEQLELSMKDIGTCTLVEPCSPWNGFSSNFVAVGKQFNCRRIGLQKQGLRGVWTESSINAYRCEDENSLGRMLQLLGKLQQNKFLVFSFQGESTRLRQSLLKEIQLAFKQCPKTITLFTTHSTLAPSLQVVPDGQLLCRLFTNELRVCRRLIAAEADSAKTLKRSFLGPPFNSQRLIQFLGSQQGQFYEGKVLRNRLKYITPSKFHSLDQAIFLIFSHSCNFCKLVEHSLTCIQPELEALGLQVYKCHVHEQSEWSLPSETPTILMKSGEKWTRIQIDNATVKSPIRLLERMKQFIS